MYAHVERDICFSSRRLLLYYVSLLFLRVLRRFVSTWPFAAPSFRILRYRVFESTLARCFLAEFGKTRSVSLSDLIGNKVMFVSADVVVAAGLKCWF